jgi:hypothetical protein
MKKNLLVGCLGAGLILCGVGRAEAQQPAADLRSVRSQIESFETVLNRDLQQTFEHPFALLQDAKGTYLPSFGMAFHMEVNLVPMRSISPFDVRPYTEEELRKTRDAKLARIRQLRERVSELLLEHSGEFDAIPSEQDVAVVIHLFHLPSEMTEGLPTQVVIETSRRSLLDTKARRMTAEDFRKRMTVVEF